MPTFVGFYLFFGHVFPFVLEEFRLLCFFCLFGFCFQNLVNINPFLITESSFDVT